MFVPFKDKDNWETVLCWGWGGEALRGHRAVGEKGVGKSREKKGREKSSKESKKKETGSGRARRRRGRQGGKEKIFTVLRETMVLCKQVISDNQHLDSFSENLSKCITHVPAF